MTDAISSRSLPLSGKAAVVIGGSRSIGASIVQRLAANRAGGAITHATHLFKD